MVQQILVGIIFLLATMYIFRLVYRNLQAKSACSTNCGKCNAIDFNEIEEQLRKKPSDN
jgi:bacterioferritin-associated ferredoxin